MSEDLVLGDAAIRLASQIKEAGESGPTTVRQGKVISIQAGPPRSVTVDIGGTNYSGVRVMDHVNITVNEGVWILSLGSGRWLVVGTRTNSAVSDTGQFVLKSGDTMTGGLTVSSGGIAIEAGGLSVVGSTVLSGASAGLALYDRDGGGDHNVIYRNTNVLRFWTSAVPGSDRATLDDSGNFAVTGYVSAATGVTVGGSNVFSWSTHGGQIYMTDSTWIRTNDKGIWLGSGTFGTNGNLVVGTGGATDGSYPVWLNASVKTGGIYSTGGITLAGGITSANQHVNNYTGGSAPVSWAAQNFVMQGSPNVGIAFHVPAAYFAPYLRHYQSVGRIDCVDSGGGAYATFGAAGYYTDSSIEVKENVEVPQDDALLQKIFWAQAKKYDMKARRKAIRPTERFKDVNSRWTAKGHTPLDHFPNHYTMEDHDCAIDGCEGDANHPCRLILEDKNRIGLIAEEVHELFPEITSCNFETGAPEGLFVEQMAALSVGAVAALTRKTTELLMRVDQLEAELAALRMQ